MTRSLFTTITLLLLVSYSAFGQCTADILTFSNPICIGQSATLTATPGGTSYQWFQNGQPVGSNSDTLTITPANPGTFQYEVEITFNSCVDTSASVSVNVVALPTVTAWNSGPLCGGTLNLWANGCIGCVYSWNGPNGFVSNMQNPTIMNAMPWFNGVYTVLVSNGLCTSSDTTVVNIQLGTFSVTASNNGPVCIGDTLELSATAVTGATYTWYGPNNFTSAMQNASIVVDSTTVGGVYTLIANVSGCTNSDTTLVQTCNTMFFDLYNDLNNNCVYEIGTDAEMFLPVTVEIDSNGIALDTISAIGGIFYTPLGVSGDVYTFKILSLPGDLVPTCPVTGIVDQIYQPYTFANINMGVACSTSNSFDLEIYATNPTTTAVTQNGTIYVQNSNCQGVTATVTLQHSPKYAHTWTYPPATVLGNTLSWSVPVTNTNAPIALYYSLHNSGLPLLAGDTTYSYFSVTPIIGDPNPNNNTWTKHDTVIASQDPNAIMAYPESCIEAGDQLQYTIMFENIGNAPAENIYVLDTLPSELDANSMELVMSSHNMFVQKTEVNGQTIFKFDFPNINLPDSSDHAGCHGMLVYNIKTNITLPYGANIDHRAGIYFDYNSVVMTNTYRSSICVPNDVVTISGSNNIRLYPNPASDELTVQADKSFNKCTITNSIGQQMLREELNGNTKLNIRSLSPGIYYIKLEGQEQQQVLKFVKM